MSTPSRDPEIPVQADESGHQHRAARLDTEQQTAAQHHPTAEDFSAVAQTEEFQQLRRRFRGFAFPMAAFFIVWYFTYVLLSTYAEGFMATRLGDSAITIGLVLGVLQFATTFLITWLYVRHANKSLDPIASRLKADLEEAR